MDLNFVSEKILIVSFKKSLLDFKESHKTKKQNENPTNFFTGFIFPALKIPVDS